MFIRKKRQIKTLPKAQLGQTLPWFCLSKGEKYMEQLKRQGLGHTNQASTETLVSDSVTDNTRQLSDLGLIKI